jgi:hypothetical protein
MRITRCLFGIDIEALDHELLHREERHQAELTALSDRLDSVLSSNAHLRQWLELLPVELAMLEATIAESNGVIDQEVTSLSPRGGRRRRVERLGRAFWGIRTRETEQIFADQEHHFAIAINRQQSQLNLALLDHLSLRQELGQLNQRLSAQYQTPPTPAARPLELYSAQSQIHEEFHPENPGLGLTALAP